MRTVEQALEKFELIDGIGDQEKTACAMSLLAWVRGRGLTDHPPCVHRLIADLVIAANDSTTVTNRKRLVAAHEAILDTWYVPDIVIAYALRGTHKLSAYARAKMVLRRVAAWKVKMDLLPAGGLVRANLQGASLQEANLQGASLQEANLQRANLQEANLEGANLEGASLQEANLEGANLRGASLRGANLQEANLEGASLRGASLGGASLRKANLRGANLREANLEGANHGPLPIGWKKNDSGIVVSA